MVMDEMIWDFNGFHSCFSHFLIFVAGILVMQTDINYIALFIPLLLGLHFIR